MLRGIWSKFLTTPVEKIGTNDDFFHLGGDSVVAMRPAAAARAEAISLTVAVIFAFPILADMATRIRTTEEVGQEDEQTFDLVPPPSSPLFRPTYKAEAEMLRAGAAAQCGVGYDCGIDLYPCTPLQEGLMALSTRSSSAYKDQRNLPIVDPEFNVAHSQRAFDAVVHAEAILRTRFVSLSTAGMLQAVVDAVSMDRARRL